MDPDDHSFVQRVTTGLYPFYKSRTAHFFKWVQKASMQVLEQTKLQGNFVLITRLTSKEQRLTSAESFYLVSFIAANYCESVFNAEFVDAMRACKEAIKCREVVCRYNATIPTDQKSAQTQSSDHTHLNFLAHMHKCYVKLKACAKRHDNATQGDPAEPKPASKPGKKKKKKKKGTLSDKKSIFQRLGELEEELDEEDSVPVEEEDISAVEEMEQSMELVMLEKSDEGANDEVSFAVSCLLCDLEILSAQMKLMWQQVQRGEVSYVAASAAVMVGYRLVVSLTSQLQLDFPAFETYEDISLCGFGVSRNQSYENRLFNSSTLATEQRSLYFEMDVIGFFLKQFASAFPPKGNKMVLLKGFFGEIYDENLSPVSSLLDFRRFLAEHLPNWLNFFRELRNEAYGRMFEKENCHFPMLGEFFQEYKKYFKEKVISLPLVFMTTTWFHSVMMLQGGMYLSHTTALTNICLRRSKMSIDTLATPDGELHKIDPTIPSHLRYTSWAIDQVLDSAALHSNNPFVAGVFILESMLTHQLLVGTSIIMATSRMRSSFHLYNALRLTGALHKPIPVMEHLFSIYEEYMFSPNRPSRDLMKTYWISSHVKATSFASDSSKFEVVKQRKRYDAHVISKLFRMLWRKDLSGISFKSISDLFTMIKNQYENEFIQQHAIGFDLIQMHSLFTDLFIRIRDKSENFQHEYNRQMAESSRYTQTMVLELCSVPVILKAAESQLSQHERIATTANKLLCDIANVMWENLTKIPMDGYSLLPQVVDPQEFVFGRKLRLYTGQSRTSQSEEFTIFSEVMDILEEHELGPLTYREKAEIKSIVSANPPILGLVSFVNIETDVQTNSRMILNSKLCSIPLLLAAGPREDSNLLEWTLQMDMTPIITNIMPIHACAMCGNIPNAKILLANKNYLQINDRSKESGGTMLHYAVENNQLEMVKFLADHCADARIQNKHRNTALDLAKTPEMREQVRKMMSFAVGEEQRLKSTSSSFLQRIQKQHEDDIERAKRTRNRLAQQVNSRKGKGFGRCSAPVVSRLDEAKANRAAQSLLEELEAEEKATQKKKKKTKAKPKKKKR